MYDSLILIDTPNISARGGRTFAPQLDLLVPIAIEYTYFPEISRSSRLPVCVGRWNLLGGVAIGSVSHVLGWYVMSGRSGLERRGVKPSHVELLPFVSYVQTCDHDHATASLYCISLDF